MSLELQMRPLACPARWVLLLALTLALLTEVLQFVAIDRYPRLLDVGIELAVTWLAVVNMVLQNRGAGISRPGRR
jgi:hypothetical protein